MRHRRHHHHHHRHHGHGHRGRWVLGFVHWRLRRRIFVGFALAAALCGAVAWALLRHGVSPHWAIVAMVFVLWGLSGALAWRLTMPLVELARVAKQLGDGHLDARMRAPRGARELDVIARTVNEMAGRIEKQLRDQRALLAAVSHEIRTPLGHLRILLEAARERGEDVTELEREVLEIDALIDQLLASSRLDFGALERRPLDVALEAARALERLGVDAGVLDVESDGCTAPADPTLLRSALANLIRNAVDHGGGVVRLAVRRREAEVEIEVDDAGPGFAADELPRVFEPFFRGAAPADGTGARGSLGLGLALVERVARAHGGSARAGNRAEGGARVTVALPA